MHGSQDYDEVTDVISKIIISILFALAAFYCPYAVFICLHVNELMTQGIHHINASKLCKLCGRKTK